MPRRVLLIAGLLFLFLIEIGKVYLIMPFPGSQQYHTIDVAYFLHKNIWLLRFVGIMMVISPVYLIYSDGTGWGKILLSGVLVFYVFVFYFFNFRFLADKMFYQPKHKLLADLSQNRVPGSGLILGISINGEAKAYPIEIIGYHHQVRDTVGGVPVLVTYCTVCRTGRVFSPIVNGKPESFRLVGMDHFNAMFEDSGTGSWWRQETGEAIKGPLKGQMLQELPSEQMRLEAWIRDHPNTLVLQPDTSFRKAYDNLKNYDIGTIPGGLEHRDSGSWKPKSWVIGVLEGGHARAYDWNDLLKMNLIQDTLGTTSIVIVIEPDSASFHVWESRINGEDLHFVRDEKTRTLRDEKTASSWGFDGYCTAGPMKGSRLAPAKAYQEFWHSWKNFHPETGTYNYK